MPLEVIIMARLLPGWPIAGKVNVDFNTDLGKIKAMHAVGQRRELTVLRIRFGRCLYRHTDPLDFLHERG